MKISKKLAQKIILKDDETETGGISFVGETLADFIEEVDMPFGIDLSYYNTALKECGIMRISLQEIKKAKQSK